MKAKANAKPRPASFALKNFDSLPDSAHVRQKDVEGLLGVSGATVWRWVRTGRLPQPRKLGPRITAWNVGDLRRVQAEAAGGVQ
jgi:predicted DNA-binding transcriptional regulator AlpA